MGSGPPETVSYECDTQPPRVNVTWTGLGSEQTYVITVDLKGNENQESSHNFEASTTASCQGMEIQLKIRFCIKISSFNIVFIFKKMSTVFLLHNQRYLKVYMTR